MLTKFHMWSLREHRTYGRAMVIPRRSDTHVVHSEEACITSNQGIVPPSVKKENSYLQIDSESPDPDCTQNLLQNKSFLVSIRVHNYHQHHHHRRDHHHQSSKRVIANTSNLPTSSMLFLGSRYQFIESTHSSFPRQFLQYPFACDSAANRGATAVCRWTLTMKHLTEFSADILSHIVNTTPCMDGVQLNPRYDISDNQAPWQHVI